MRSSDAQRATLRVLVVDDSAFMRRVVSDMIDRFPDYEVTGTARDGERALRTIDEMEPDIVTLDIEMPGLDGFEVLERVMAGSPRPVVVLSAYTADGSDAALRALELGAVDFVPKPSGPISFDMARVEARLHHALEAARAADLDALAGRRDGAVAAPVRAPRGVDGAAVVLAASTGGPRALAHILGALPGEIGAGLLIVQHMPPGFTTSLAARLDGIAPFPVTEAAGGETVTPNRAWVAPGNFHMRVRRLGDQVKLALDQRNLVWGTRPAADALFPTVAAAFGPRSVGVVLTGMGRDGAAGLAAIRAAGGRTLVQDRGSSVIFGMPGHALEQGAAERSLPLREIPTAIVRCLESFGATTV